MEVQTACERFRDGARRAFITLIAIVSARRDRTL